MNTQTPDGFHTKPWLGLAWITAFLVGTDLFIIAPLLPSIAMDMHVPPASLTVLVSIFQPRVCDRQPALRPALDVTAFPSASLRRLHARRSQCLYRLAPTSSNWCAADSSPA